MNIPVEIVELILKKAVKKANQSYDRIGLLELAAIINKQLPVHYKRLSDRYLYETPYLSIKKAKSNGLDAIQLEASSLNSVAYFLGYDDVSAFRSSHFPMIPNEVYALEGNWWSIVRCNSGRPDILVSPVRISLANDKAMLELRGPHRTYKGVIRWIGGSISSWIGSEDRVKVMHLAFQVGVARYPKTLLGVFSSVSSSGHPIAGKEILMRSHQNYDDMINYKFNISEELARAHPRIPPPIIHYLSEFDKCYFKITEIGTFDLDGF